MVAMLALQCGEWGEGGVGCGVVMRRETIVRQVVLLRLIYGRLTVVRSADFRASLRTATVVRWTTLWPRKNIVDGAAPRAHISWVARVATCASYTRLKIDHDATKFALGHFNHF